MVCTKPRPIAFLLLVAPAVARLVAAPTDPSDCDRLISMSAEEVKEAPAALRKKIRHCPRPKRTIDCSEDTFADEAAENGALWVEEDEGGYTLSWDDPEQGEGQVFSIVETSDPGVSFRPDGDACHYCTDCLDTAGLPRDWPVCAKSPRDGLFDHEDEDGNRRLSWASWLSSVCRDWRTTEALLGPLPPLPACPCFGPPAGPGWTPPAGGGIFHPGAAACVRSAGGPGFAAGQQCCYDVAGALITGGRGAGTPDRVAPDDIPGVGGHFCVDVVPFFGCSCSTYLGLRPPNTGVGCAPNVVNPCWI